MRRVKDSPQPKIFSSCASSKVAAIDRLKSLNVEFRENTPEEFRGFVKAEIEKWGKVVREANIKLG